MLWYNILKHTMYDIEEAVFLVDRIVIMTPNPEKIKSVVTVPLKGHRERTASGFLTDKFAIGSVLTELTLLCLTSIINRPPKMITILQK